MMGDRPAKGTAARAEATPHNRTASTSRVVSYGFAIAGPVIGSVAQFALALVLLRILSKEEFGSFSFLLVASQFSCGLSSALLCAPFAIYLGRPGEEAAARRTFLSTNLVFAGAAGGFFAALALLLGLPGVVAATFGLYAGAMLLRWFARAYAYAHGTQWRTVISDLTYGATLLAGTLLVLVTDGKLIGASSALAVSVAIALLPFGWSYLFEQFLRFSSAALLRYREVWQKHSMWSLLGVATTEATANAHAYVVTLVAGPAAFAPLIATALLIRPIGLSMNALGDFVRPQIARQLAEGVPAGQMVRELRVFRVISLAVWVCTALGAVVLLMWPRLLFPATYELGVIRLACLLWLAIALVRILRGPESTLLQAAGDFRALALASATSCVLSVVTVVALVTYAQPVWTLLGILMGEALFAAGVTLRARQLYRDANWTSGVSKPAG